MITYEYFQLFIYILVSNGFDFNATSPTEEIDLKSPVSIQNLSHSTEQLTTFKSSSSHHYRNPRLERIVNAKRSKSQLSLNSLELVDQDMGILTSYLSQNDTVRINGLFPSLESSSYK